MTHAPMKAEKIILSFIGVFCGLLVAASAFYFYQINNKPVKKVKSVAIAKPTPTPTPPPNAFFVNIDEPADESVSDKKTLTIAGKSIADATLIISSPTIDQVIQPSENGDFSTTTTLDSGENQIIITAIAPNGEEIKKTITVTYSNESF